ncbi:hypothetical protein GCM10027566_18120 [Arachidicoccus ginsenosidivorans]|jgi:hypothetical protein
METIPLVGNNAPGLSKVKTILINAGVQDTKILLKSCAENNKSPWDTYIGTHKGISYFKR